MSTPSSSVVSPVSSSSSLVSFLSSLIPFTTLRRALSRHPRLVLSTARDTLFSLLLLYVLLQIRRLGLRRFATGCVMKLLSCSSAGRDLLAKEKKSALGSLDGMIESSQKPFAGELKTLALPSKGMSRDDILSTLRKWKGIEEQNWKEGWVSGSIYHGEEGFSNFLTESYRLFAMTNPLQSDVFPAVVKMESEIIAMMLKLFNAPEDATGSLSSGGTESIILAMKTYRDWIMDKRPSEFANGERPEILCCISAHAAFDKAAQLLHMRIVHVKQHPETFEMDLEDTKRLISPRTAVIIGSAPQYPQGVFDPIPQLAAIAQEHEVGLHVDACLGSLLVPFLKLAGYLKRDFDFSIPGVTSMTADTHKWGFAPKGSSVVLYRSPELHSYQYFVVPDWTGGIYASATLPGSRPGGLIVACWAALMATGMDGYMQNAHEIHKLKTTIVDGIKRIPELKILGACEFATIAIGCTPASNMNIYHVLAAMGEDGRQWHLTSLQNPPGFNLTLSRLHIGKEEKFLSDLRDAVQVVKSNPQRFANQGMAGIYGMKEGLPDSSMVEELARAFLNKVGTAKPSQSQSKKQ